MSSGQQAAQQSPGERIAGARFDRAVDYGWVEVEASQNNVSTLAFWPAHTVIRPVRIAVGVQMRVSL